MGFTSAPENSMKIAERSARIGAVTQKASGRKDSFFAKLHDE